MREGLDLFPIGDHLVVRPAVVRAEGTFEFLTRDERALALGGIGRGKHRGAQFFDSLFPRRGGLDIHERGQCARPF